MVVHSKTCDTFACRCLREAVGPQDADLAWAWVTSPTTVATRRLGRDVSSRTKTATWALSR